MLTKPIMGLKLLIWNSILRFCFAVPLEIDLGRGTLSIEKINFITLPNMGVIGFDGDQEVNEACRALGVS